METPAALRALLKGSIDYAGMFPPAKLDLSAAMEEFLRHRQRPESWMLARFICPAASLSELADSILAQPTDIGAISVSVVASPSQPDELPFARLSKDLKAIEKFQSTCEERARVDALEVRVPDDADDSALDHLRQLLGPHESWLEANLFLEMGFAEDWDRRLRILQSDLQEAFRRRIAFKIRCGGTTASAIPTTQQVAEFILQCQRSGSNWKATAGLHHPFPTMDESLNARMHGFVNVLGTAAMGAIHQFELPLLCAALDDADPANWKFSNDGLTWREYTVTKSQITAARNHVCMSFGSCSFDEPVSDLKALGWI